MKYFGISLQQGGMPQDLLQGLADCGGCENDGKDRAGAGRP